MKRQTIRLQVRNSHSTGQPCPASTCRPLPHVCFRYAENLPLTSEAKAALMRGAQDIVRDGENAFVQEADLFIADIVTDGLLVSAWQALEAASAAQRTPAARKELKRALPNLVGFAVGAMENVPDDEYHPFSDTVGIRLQARAAAVQARMTGIREKAHKKRLAATRAAAKDAALTAALPGVLQASEQQEEADLIEITRARYRGFVEIESDDEESEESEEDGTGDTAVADDAVAAAVTTETELADLGDFGSSNLSRRLSRELGERGLLAVDKYVSVWKECMEGDTLWYEREEKGDFTDPSKYEKEVVSHLPMIVGDLAREVEHRDALAAAQKLEMLMEIGRLQAKVQVMKEVLHDVCPLACAEKFEAWMDK